MEKNEIVLKCEIPVIASRMRRSNPDSPYRGMEGRLLRAVALAMTTTIMLGCTEPITIKTDDSPPVVAIYSELTNELKNQKIMISRSSPYFEDQPNEGVTNAEVVVSSSEGETYRFIENDSIKGLYLSQKKFGVKSGVNYNLSAAVDTNHDGVPDVYQASTMVLPAIVPDSLSINPIDVFGRKNYILFAYFQDPPEDSYFLYNVYKNDTLLTDQISKYIVTDDALFKGQNITDNVYFFKDASQWKTDPEEERKRSAYLSKGDIITTEIREIPKGYYDFISQCQKEKNGENPMFGGPSSNINTNISNGGVGYFVGYCVERRSIEFK